MSIGGSQTSSSADPVGGSTTLTAPGRPSNKDPRSTARGSAAGQSLSSDTYSATESPASSQPYLGGVVLASPSSSSALRSAVTGGDGGTYSSATPRSHASKSGRPTLSQSRDDAQETHSRKPAQTSQYYPSGGSNAGRGGLVTESRTRSGTDGYGSRGGTAPGWSGGRVPPTSALPPEATQAAAADRHIRISRRLSGGLWLVSVLFIPKF